MAAPKTSVFENTGDLELVRGPTGVATTAVPEPEPQPIQPVTVAPAQEEILQREQFEEVAPPIDTLSEFSPSDVSEEVDVQKGSFGATVEAGLQESISGALLDLDRLTPSQQAKLDLEFQNYAGRNPKSAIAGHMLGRFTGDAPLELMIAIGSGGVGAGMRAASRLGTFSKSAMQVDRAVDTMQQAGLASRVGRAAGQDALEGFAAGVASEKLREQMGRGGTTASAIETGLSDAVIAPFFGMAMRGAAKLGGKAIDTFRGDFESRMVNKLHEETGLPKDELKTAIKDQMDSDEAIPKAKVDDPSHAVILGDHPKLVKAWDDVQSAADVEAFALRVLRPEEAHLAPNFATMIEARADALGLGVGDYVKARGLKFDDTAGVPSTLFSDSDVIIKAPAKATNFVDLIHEVGHVMRGDMSTLKEGKRMVAALEKRYGVKSGEPWSVDAEEQFAEDLVKSLTGDIKVPSKVAKAFRAVGRWLSKVYGSLIGGTVNDDMTEVVEALFDPDLNISLRDDRFDLSGPKQIELFAPERKAPPKDVQQAQQDQRDIRSETLASIENSPMVPKSKLGERILSVKKKVGRLLYSDNLTLNLMLRQLGPVGERISDMGVKAMNTTGMLRGKMLDTIEDLREGVPASAFESMSKKKSIKLKVADGDRNKSEIDVELPIGQWMKLVMYARDGRGAGAKGKDGKHSARLNLMGARNKEGEPIGGFLVNGKQYFIHPDDINDLASGDLVGLTSDQKRIVDGILKAYQSIVPDANKLSNVFVGKDIFDSKNKEYNPKKTAARGDSDSDVMFENILLPREAVKGGVIAREGFAELELVDPMAELSGYIERVGHMLGHIEYNKSLDTFLNKGKISIKQNFGRDYLASLTDLAKVSRGDRSGLGKGTGSFLGKLFTLRQIGILSLNPSSVAKQPASAFSAAASGHIDRSGGEILRRAGQLLLNGKLRQEVVAEMNKYSPAWKDRQRTRVRVMDLEDASENTAHLTLGRGELRTKEILDLTKRGEIKLSDAAIEQLTRGLKYLKTSDESTMASVWEASKAKVQADSPDMDFKSDEYFDKVNEVFTKVMMDSQPTKTPTTASMNQMQTGLPFRAMTQFSTQTRKNFEMADKAITEYSNLPPDARDATATQKLANVLLPLMYQTAYVTAAGAVAMGGVNAAAQQLESKAMQRRRARQENEIAKRLFSRFVRDFFGQVPVSGAVLSSLFVSPLGEPVYDISIPVFGEMTQSAKAISDENLSQLISNLSTLFGVPMPVKKAGAALAK